MIIPKFTDLFQYLVNQVDVLFKSSRLKFADLSIHLGPKIL